MGSDPMRRYYHHSLSRRVRLPVPALLQLAEEADLATTQPENQFTGSFRNYSLTFRVTLPYIKFLAPERFELSLSPSLAVGLCQLVYGALF